MKTILLATALVVASLAHAEPLDKSKIAGMVAQNDAVMDKAICAVANDHTAKPGETIKVIGPDGVQVFSRAAYDRIRGAGYSKTKAGRWQMSVNIEKGCKKDAETDDCRLARLFWKTVPPSVSPPDGGVPVK